MAPCRLLDSSIEVGSDQTTSAASKHNTSPILQRCGPYPEELYFVYMVSYSDIARLQPPTPKPTLL